MGYHDQKIPLPLSTAEKLGRCSGQGEKSLGHVQSLIDHYIRTMFSRMNCIPQSTLVADYLLRSNVAELPARSGKHQQPGSQMLRISTSEAARFGPPRIGARNSMLFPFSTQGSLYEWIRSRNKLYLATHRHRFPEYHEVQSLIVRLAVEDSKSASQVLGIDTD